MATTTIALTPAAAWLATYRTAKAAIIPYSSDSVVAFLDVLKARPRYLGPMTGHAHVTDEGGLEIVGRVSEAELVPLLEWIGTTFGMEDEAR